MNNIGFRRTHMCAELNEANAGELVNLSGWVQRTRNLGSIIFVWLRDRTGLVQLVFDEKDCDKETFALGESLRTAKVTGPTGVEETSSYYATDFYLLKKADYYASTDNRTPLQ